jgi:hypothetical protein
MKILLSFDRSESSYLDRYLDQQQQQTCLRSSSTFCKHIAMRTERLMLSILMLGGFVWSAQCFKASNPRWSHFLTSKSFSSSSMSPLYFIPLRHKPGASAMAETRAGKTHPWQLQMGLGKKSTAREVLSFHDADLRGRTALITGIRSHTSNMRWH